jgi:hypothetical protein
MKTWTIEPTGALKRLQSADPWRTGDLVIRGLCSLLLLGCGSAVGWLCRLVRHLPPSTTSVAELAAGALVVTSWTTGWAALAKGQGLFGRIMVPGRHAVFHPIIMRADT